MNSQKIISLLAIAGVAGFFGGCASEPESHLVTAPPPSAPTGSQQVVVTQPQQQVLVAQPQQQVIATTAVAGPSYIVMQAPPAPQAPEAVPARPSSQHLWIPGYWTWQNNRYAWMAGHWELPPSNTTAWVNPRWEPEGGAYRFYEGHWN